MREVLKHFGGHARKAYDRDDGYDVVFTLSSISATA